MIIANNRGCLAYTLRLKREDESLFGERPKVKGKTLDAPLVNVGQGLLICPEMEKFKTSYDNEKVPVDYLKTDEIDVRSYSAMKAYEYAGSLMKVGKKTNKWISRWHELRNHTMLIYSGKYSK